MNGITILENFTQLGQMIPHYLRLCPLLAAGENEERTKAVSLRAHVKILCHVRFHLVGGILLGAGTVGVN
ncbi:hypothetical protein BSAF29S_01860 [Bacillus safensis subsp. safensis]